MKIFQLLFLSCCCLFIQTGTILAYTASGQNNVLYGINSNSQMVKGPVKPYLIQTDGELVRFIANNNDHTELILTGLIEGEVYEVFISSLSGEQSVSLEMVNSSAKSKMTSEVFFVAEKENHLRFSSEDETGFSEFYISVVSVQKPKGDLNKSMLLLQVDSTVST